MESDELTLKPSVGVARAIARKLLKDSGVNIVPVSLPKVISFLKTQYDLEVLPYAFGEKISGLLVMIDGSATIGFNSDDAWVRRRLTIAHEIGHLLMGHTCRGPETKNIAETEAYQFGRELLMPLVFLRKDFARTPNVDTLAKKYIVSKEALCIHLMDCKIL